MIAIDEMLARWTRPCIFQAPRSNWEPIPHRVFLPRDDDRDHKDNLYRIVDESSIPFLDFWASSCAPCRNSAPVFESPSEAHPDVVFGRINTEQQQKLAAGFRVASIPTLFVFPDGIIVFNQPEALSSPQLEQALAAVRGLDMDEVRASMAPREDDASKAR